MAFTESRYRLAQVNTSACPLMQSSISTQPYKCRGKNPGRNPNRGRMAGRAAISEDEEAVLNGRKVQPFSIPKAQERTKNDPESHSLTSFHDILGLKDLVSQQVWRASVAELLGSGILVFTIDTIVISSYQTDTNSPNLIMSFLIAVTIAILLLATSPISGGHINPVITFSAFLAGLVSVSRAVVYFVAQCAGAVLGALALKAVVGDKIEDTFSLGGCTLTVIGPGPNGPVVVGVGTAQALWLEIFCTFVFLFASIWMAFDPRQAQALGRVKVFSIIGIVVGLLVFVSTTVTATKGYAGAGMNPARCLGPALVRGGHLWKGHWVFWSGPAIACVAFFVYIKIIPNHHIHPL